MPVLHTESYKESYFSKWQLQKSVHDAEMGLVKLNGVKVRLFTMSLHEQEV